MNITSFLPRVRRRLVDLFNFRSQWESAGCPSPAPQKVKWAVLERYGITDAMWIETGTHLGNTTAHLARQGVEVVSIEPETALAAKAELRFRSNDLVTVVNARSQDALPGLIASRAGRPLNFWLDGHWSKGDTFKDEVDTPVLEELVAITNLFRSQVEEDFVVFVDDVRLFTAHHQQAPEENLRRGYPGLDLLVDWAQEHNLWWTIEQDIFVARTSSPQFGNGCQAAS